MGTAGTIPTLLYLSSAHNLITTMSKLDAHIYIHILCSPLTHIQILGDNLINCQDSGLS
jgi:hypothetical protein